MIKVSNHFTHFGYKEKSMPTFSKDPDAISRLSPEQYRVTQ